MAGVESVGDEVGHLGLSQAVWAGGFVFVSGQPGIGADGRPGAGVRDQAQLAFANLAAVLTAAGSSLAHLVRTTTLVRDMADLAAIVEVRRAVLQPPYPADTVFQVTALARPEFLLEIDAVAVVGS